MCCSTTNQRRGRSSAKQEGQEGEWIIFYGGSMMGIMRLGGLSKGLALFTLFVMFTAFVGFMPSAFAEVVYMKQATCKHHSSAGGPSVCFRQAYGVDSSGWERGRSGSIRIWLPDNSSRSQRRTLGKPCQRCRRERTGAYISPGSTAERMVWTTAGGRSGQGACRGSRSAA